MIYKCECCGYKADRKSSYDKHNKTEKHKKKLLTYKPVPEKKKARTKKLNMKCDHCGNTFGSKEDFEEHMKLKCKMNVKHNNIYKFNTKTFGKYIYPDEVNAGDVYIIQTEFAYNKFYKIGITTDLYKRIKGYRTGSVYEPRMHYHFPTKDIKLADDKLKEKFQNFNVKREIYQGDLDYFKDEILSTLTEINGEEAKFYKPEIKSNDIFLCEVCNNIFETEQDYILHEHDEDKILLKCEFCDTEFTMQKNLKRHMETRCHEKMKKDCLVPLREKEKEKEQEIEIIKYQEKIKFLEQTLEMKEKDMEFLKNLLNKTQVNSNL